jgi:DNA-binding transcriptional MerR regulator
MRGKKFTTSETARLAGLHLVTLQRWIAAGKVKAPKPTLLGAVGYRLWAPRDIERLRNVKNRIYRRGRGRKPKPKD